MVSSNWAAHARSLVETVHPSLQSSGEESASHKIGSMVKVSPGIITPGSSFSEENRVKKKKREKIKVLLYCNEKWVEDYEK